MGFTRSKEIITHQQGDVKYFLFTLQERGKKHENACRNISEGYPH